MSDRIPGAGGGMTTWFELWRATIDNELVENITWALDGGNVDMNRDRTVTTQATFNLRDAAIVSPYTDFRRCFRTRHTTMGAIPIVTNRAVHHQNPHRHPHPKQADGGVHRARHHLNVEPPHI